VYAQEGLFYFESLGIDCGAKKNGGKSRRGSMVGNGKNGEALRRNNR